MECVDGGRTALEKKKLDLFYRNISMKLFYLFVNFFENVYEVAQIIQNKSFKENDDGDVNSDSLVSSC